MHSEVKQHLVRHVLLPKKTLPTTFSVGSIRLVSPDSAFWVQ